MAQRGRRWKTTFYNQKKETIEETEDALQDQIKLELRILDVRRLVIEAERRILDYRKEQKRKALENVADVSRGKLRITAIENLKKFDIAEARRRADDRQIDLEAEQGAALDRIKGAENEQAEKARIAEESKAKGLLSEAEYQNELKNIRDSYKSSEIDARDNADPFNQFAAGIGGYLENVALIKDANGQLHFSFDQLFSSITDLGLQAFGQLAAGFGQMASNWVLYGNAGGQDASQVSRAGGFNRYDLRDYVPRGGGFCDNGFRRGDSRRKSDAVFTGGELRRGSNRRGRDRTIAGGRFF